MDQALEALKNAIAGLVKIPEEIPPTGDARFVMESMALLVIMAMAIATVVFVDQKKYRR